MSASSRSEPGARRRSKLWVVVLLAYIYYRRLTYSFKIYFIYTLDGISMQGKGEKYALLLLYSSVLYL
jgi:hypothetical protein